MDTIESLQALVAEMKGIISDLRYENATLAAMIEKTTEQRDDGIKIAMLILEHSSVNPSDNSKHVHKYAVDMLGVLRHKIPYELSTKC